MTARVHRRRPPITRRFLLWSRPLDSHRILLAARRKAALDDFGAPEFREGLDRLVDAVQGGSAPTRRMGAQWNDRLVGLLAERLRAQDLAKRSAPRAGSARPLIVVGVPGAGAEEVGRLFGRPDPGPQSELALSFHSIGFVASGPVEDYADWVVSADAAPAYRFMRRQRQADAPNGRWLLAHSDHLWHLATALEVFPEARVAWIHADPAEAIAGAVGAADSSGGRNRAGLSGWWLSRSLAASSAALTVLDQLDDAGRVLHVRRSDLRRDRRSAAERLADHAGWPSAAVSSGSSPAADR